jgi:hypothetical protein
MGRLPSSRAESIRVAWPASRGWNATGVTTAAAMRA